MQLHCSGQRCQKVGLPLLYAPASESDRRASTDKAGFAHCAYLPAQSLFVISAYLWQIDRVSAYCPLLLFADDDATRMRALIALAESPQNNLSIRTREIECANPQRGRPPTSLGLREVCPIPRWLSCPSSVPPALHSDLQHRRCRHTAHGTRQLRL